MTDNFARLAGSASAALLLAMAVILPGSSQAQNAARTIVVALDEEPESLDGCNANRSATGRVVRNNIVEGLTEIDPADGSLKPRLATAWQRVDDLTWRFTLRQGVTFHDGSAFDAAAVSAAIARTLDTRIDCQTRQKFFGGVKIEGKPVDAHTVDIVSDKPIPILPTYMGLLMIGAPAEPRDKLTREPIGTGPYQFTGWTPGTDIRVKRNDGWWGGKPEAEAARYVWRTESAVRAAMVKIGEADIAANIAVQDATDPALDFSYPNAETSWLRIDTLTAPLNDRRVRLALNYAVDRNALRGSILSKDVIPATQAVVASVAGHNSEIDKRVWPYDPQRARQLLTEAKAAGVPVDKEILLYGRTNIYPNAAELMEAILAMYQAVGLNVKMRMVELAEWLSFHNAPFSENRPPIVLQTQHDNNFGDPVFTFYYKYACQGTNSQVCDPELDRKIAAATGGHRGATDRPLARSLPRGLRR